MEVFLGVAGVLLVILVVMCMGNAARAQDDFYSRFPPISDEEFVARCGPGRNAAIAIKVRRILADCLWVEYERIHPSSRLSADLLAE